MLVDANRTNHVAAAALGGVGDVHRHWDWGARWGRRGFANRISLPALALTFVCA